MSTAFRFCILWTTCLLDFVHVFTCTNYIVVPNKRKSCNLLSIICVLCVFVILPLGQLLSAFAVRHLPEGILWTGFRAAAGCLPVADRAFAKTGAPTSCLLFSTGWTLIVRAGNQERQPQESMATPCKTHGMAFSTKPLSLFSVPYFPTALISAM